MNSSQMLFGPSEISVTSVKSFGITHSGHQLLFANSSLVTMDSLSSVSQMRTNRGLKTSTVSGVNYTVSCQIYQCDYMYKLQRLLHLMLH